MTDTANLEDGFYWVRMPGGGDWVIACREDGYFYIPGNMTNFTAVLFDEIDPRPIKREE